MMGGLNSRFIEVEGILQISQYRKTLNFYNSLFLQISALILGCL